MPEQPDAPAPLRGVRVVELAHWAAGPAAGGVLADWGADVVKVEPPEGDPMRHLFGRPTGTDDGPVRHAPSFSAMNRAKRSVAVDLATADGRALFEALLERADVFLTNVRPAALERLGLAPDAVRRRFGRLVYCSVSAYGWEGPARDDAGYDLAGFFARTGVLHQLTPPGASPSPYMNGMGDLFTAMSAVAGILAALQERHRTGRGRFVEATLLRTGLWSMAGELSLAASGGNPRPVADRTDSATPLFNVYRAGDDRWFVLVGVEADRHLPAVLRALDLAHLLEDERFNSGAAVRRHRQAFIAVLDERLATRSLAEWAERFAAEDVWWAPVQTPAEAAADPQGEAAGAWVDYDNGAGRAVDAPIRFDGHDRRTTADAPALGAHTAELRRELGLDREDR
ncbi:MAG: CaiB/BaiF CoA transferase family protein [Acidimicrobiia bacterium]